MKAALTGITFFLLSATGIHAQTHSKTTKSHYHSQQSVTGKKGTRAASGQTAAIMSDTTSHSAYTGDSRLLISDPTINVLKARAEGNNIPVSKSGIVGMPKHNYGFANGHIILHSNGSTTFGSMTGTGGVETGSSPGAVGAYGNGTGLNGKSPYAGNGMFGTIVPGTENGTKIINKVWRDSTRKK